MRPFRLRILLPSIQIVVAVILLTSNYLRPDPPHNPASRAADLQFCDGLNAPAALAKYLLMRIVYREVLFPYSPWAELIVQTVVYLGLIGLLWYVVGLEIDRRTRGGPSRSTARTCVRPIADSLLIAFGITLAIVAVKFHAGAGTYYGLFGILHLSWAVVIVAFYGHDLWIVLARRTRSPTR
jgi:hypothetical protein